ncbi:hypothetical protein QVD17_03007 [Tagetes erecta]|uniref:Uncharacterized protein n=1 Tax=Tagetes erecta TaxID=13708 RepID=A0AAD8L7L1_TARER|nr:hypothetical protein QVD17_03007 [Tagetes erecta]
MGAQDLHQKLDDLVQIRTKFINNSSRKHSWKTKRNPTRNNALKRKRVRRVGCRRSTMIEKKVRTLKKLVPNAGSSVGLDGLFRETAAYISNLEIRVRLMQAVVKALSNSDSL